MIRMAKNCEARDLSKKKLMALIDPNNKTTMTLEEFKSAINTAKTSAPDFSFSDAEINSIFKALSSSQSYTVKVSTTDLVEEVFKGVESILVDQVRVTLARAHLKVDKLFDKYDKNKDGFLEHSELLQALSDSHLVLQPNMSAVLIDGVLDPKTSKRPQG